jgi:FkbM family methyltransferase
MGELAETKERIKRFIMRVAPEPLLFALKKYHYVRAIRFFAEPEVTVIQRLVKPGDHVIDVGANVGWYTRVLSELVGERGRVYSIEPVPPTFELLSFCVKKLGLTNVELMNYALSDQDGAALMEIPPYEWGAENFYEARVVDATHAKTGSRQFTVRMRSLDSIFAGLFHAIVFIKCDVEGHEFPLLTGADQLITKSRPAWLIEVGGNPDISESSSARLFEYFHSKGYTGYGFDGQRLNRRRAGDAYANYFFVTSDHLGVLRAAGVMIQP